MIGGVVTNVVCPRSLIIRDEKTPRLRVEGRVRDKDKVRVRVRVGCWGQGSGSRVGVRVRSSGFE
jgi:hypothetical protein